MTEIAIIRPDDWHLHVRDGDMLKAVVPHTSAHFGRAIIMPNLVPPVATLDQARAYRSRIEACVPEGHDFKPLMTLYLTETTDPEDVAHGHKTGEITAVKLYPAGATTNSQSGVRDVERVFPVLERMAEIGLPLCVHGEVTDKEVDIFDREAVFLERVLEPLRRRFPKLRVVLEHVTTRNGVEYVRAGGPSIAATITTHHLVINRNAILAGGIRPHYYCLPVAKRETHRLALLEAATSADARFFLGTDSAPHVNAAKQSGCGCAGIFTASVTMPILAQVFENAGKLENLEGFASRHGAQFYGLEPNVARLVLRRLKAPVRLGGQLAVGDDAVTMFDPGMDVFWEVAER